MARPLLVRVAGAFGVTALALFFVGLIPFLSAGPTAGAGFTASTPAVPAVSVNREFKGDRLPLPSDVNSAVSQYQSGSRRQARKPDKIPLGCDAAFSPVSSPRLANIYGRCMT